ncbi:cation:proton antiporter [Piscinibacter sakaiensis]|uniref:Monovalent cation:proton antiporter-2 CPA2 family n=1 Tax=Piscinibacter sakaiensis TaxID=1547922 RepID=A0A0K8NW47_PISS1|nr:cation:proton antiporter [Piscinibacter sakaiensis]GAP34514.1 monovalent cation:proton antiporter-2 CPA2 family [Piscinibacter sakaiensis]
MNDLLAFSSAASAPLWTLDGLRGADPALGMALLMALAVVATEALNRLLRLPRACGYMLVGALASPLLLRMVERTDLDPWKPLLDLAIAILVFELGSRIRPRWLVDNPVLALTCLLEGLAAGAAVTGALVWLGAPLHSAAVAGAVAMSTSPVLTMVALHDLRPRGQVSERLQITTALNSVLAMLALKAWGVSTSQGADLLSAGSNAVVVVAGSFVLGAACGLAMDRLSRPIRGARALPVLQIALVVIASLLAVQWTLSPLLAMLVAGMVARHQMRHALTVEPQLGSAGAVLSVLLMICFGLLLTLDGLNLLWPWVLAIVVARLVAKGLVVVALARPSGLGWRQAAALTLALQPMSSLAVLLAADNFGWPGQFPGIDEAVLQALLVATTLMQLSGPLWTQLALSRVVRETA